MELKIEIPEDVIQCMSAEGVISDSQILFSLECVIYDWMKKSYPEEIIQKWIKSLGLEKKSLKIASELLEVLSENTEANQWNQVN